MTPIAAAKLDIPVYNYDIVYGDTSAMLAVNKYNGEFCINNDHIKMNDATGNEETYNLTHEEILCILAESPDDAVVTEHSKESQTVTYDEIMEYMDNHNLEFNITSESHKTTENTCKGFLSKLPTWAKVVASVVVVALVIGAVVASSTVSAGAAVSAACLGVIAAVSALDRIWDDGK